MANKNRFSGLMGDLNQSGDSEPVAEEINAESSKPVVRKSTKKQTSTSPKRAKYEDKENYKQVGLYLPVETHKRMKIGAAIAGKEMSEIATEGIELWLKKNVPNI
ncbi:MAG: hypothetical protein AAFV85_26820 [Cyanobacteria bacterium J06634_6]